MPSLVRRLAALAAVSLLAAAAPAAAEAPATGDPAAPPPGLTIGERPSVAPAEDWTRDELAALARALTGMGVVMREGRQALVRAEDDAARRAIQEEVFVGLLLAVESAGLTYERYNALVAAMNADPDMRAEVEAHLARENAAADPAAPARDAPAGAPPAAHEAPAEPAEPAVGIPVIDAPAAPGAAEPPSAPDAAEPSAATPPSAAAAGAPSGQPPPVPAGEPDSESGIPAGLPPPIPTGEIDPPDARAAPDAGD